MSLVHQMPIEIGFKHCDPAGIVFYPRYTEMVHDTVEHWFNHGLKQSFYDLHSNRNLGIPTVNLQIDFRIPSKLGDVITSNLSVKHLGRSSMKVQLQFCGPDGAVRVEALLTVVFASLDVIRAVEIPEDLRALIQPYMAFES